MIAPSFYFAGFKIDINKCATNLLKHVFYLRDYSVYHIKYILNEEKQNIFRQYIQWSNGIDNLIPDLQAFAYDYDTDVFVVMYQDIKENKYAVEFQVTLEGDVNLLCCQSDDDFNFTSTVDPRLILVT